jgi:hypothetical protein
VFGFLINSALKCLLSVFKAFTNPLKANEMPIEIKELHIKINVDENASGTTADSADMEGIMRAISESVEQIVTIEQRKKER